MQIRSINARKPDVQINMTWDEADRLCSMVIEGKGYASDCGESTQPHDTFIGKLQEVLDENAFCHSIGE